MNLESLLGGGGTGFLVAIGTFFGFHKRLNVHKEALKKLQEEKVEIKFCDERHKLVEKTYDEVKYIRERIDVLVNSRNL